MWAEVNGERKKVACGPCIRGHRSSKCDHRDRVLVEVRKPGRPLSSCPHPTGSCSCERVVINYTIPKASQCACPSEREAPTATVVGNSRISKGRRKSTAVTPFYLDKAIRAGLDTETDTSSSTQAPSETSGSNAPSLPSSASSTPRLLPAQNESISSCCKPKQQPKQAPAAVQAGGCCGSKVNPAPEPPTVQKKSCCSGTPKKTAPSYQPNGYPPVGPQFQYLAQTQGMMQQYQMPHPQTLSSNATNPFGLGTPIYNHAAAAYHQSNSVPMSPGANAFMPPNMTPSAVNQHVPEHNCYCGESCSCFGCAAHPNNATMMEYVRVMAHFQYTGGFGGMAPPLYDMPAYPHQPGYGAEAGQRIGYDSMSQGMTTPTQTQMSSQTSLDSPTRPNQSMSIPVDWQQPLTAIHDLSQTSFLRNIDYTNPNAINENHPPLKREDTTDTSTADSPGDNKDEDTPTLSPSSFFWNEMTLPGCSDASGTCQCGDGCACVGCLTHGGHTGEHLEDISTTEQTTFPDFAPNLSFNMNSPTNFMGFTAGPS